VPADEAQLRFFVDESALGLGKTLEVARRDVIHPGHRLIPEVGTGALDHEWIPAVAARDLVVIARDRHIRSKPAEVALLREHGLRGFWLAGKKDLSTWDALVRVVRRWSEIERTVDQRGAGPWFCAINENAINEMTLR
jgi:PIN like domain